MLERSGMSEAASVTSRDVTLSINRHLREGASCCGIAVV